VLTKNDLGFYDNDGNFVVESGVFDIMVGTNSEDVLTGQMTLK
jgi:beta-glucosidase